jgi:hypothetical protein
LCFIRGNYEISVIWDPVEFNGSFGETYRLNLQAQRISQATVFVLYAGLLFGLFFGPEDGGHYFARKR